MKRIIPGIWPWAMVPARTILFLVFQALFALAFVSTGLAQPWDASAVWWPFTVTFTNLVCLALLTRLFQVEGQNYWAIFKIDRQHLKSDLLAMLGVLVISGPVAFLPNILLGSWLFGDQMAAVKLFIRPLPIWAAVVTTLAFPLTQAITELPTYFLYSARRIEQQTCKPWLAVTVTALALGLQHLAVPFLPNGRFILWRATMFIPFAFLVGIVLRWRPRLMPYLSIVHFLMDFSTMLMFFTPM